ncbi:MAG: DUF2237 domain-containing protein [Desulfobacterales bacterium]|jgi:hypothetical protein
MKTDKNVLGAQLKACSMSPLTGFNRNGYCQTAEHDIGVHGVCSEVTEDFLNFTKARGNDLSSPNKLYGFPGLKPGDRWCLCASRWKEALDNDVAPGVVLSATSEAALEYVGLDDLLNHAVDIEH